MQNISPFQDATHVRLVFHFDKEGAWGTVLDTFMRDARAHDLSEQLPRARTFAQAHEIEGLRAAGLARGGSLDNAVVVDGARVLNLCRDRHRFAVAFAAALLRGRPSLLTADRSPARLDAIARRHDGPVRPRRRRPRHEHERPDPHGPAVPDDRLPPRPAADVRAFHPFG